jgi:hypothetical protein
MKPMGEDDNIERVRPGDLHSRVSAFERCFQSEQNELIYRDQSVSGLH